MWRNLASNVLTLLIVALVFGAGALGYAQRQYSTDGPLAEAICLQVAPGSNMSRVADDLEAQGAVTSAMLYRLGAQYSDRSHLLKAGSFLIDEGTSMQEIVAQVTGDGLSTCGTEVIYRVSVSGQSVRVRELNPVSQAFEETANFNPRDEVLPDPYVKARDDVATRYRIVVAEGVTSWQIVDALMASDVFEGEVAAVPAEGTLAPDGYEFRPGADRAAFLAQMEAAQAVRLAEAWESRGSDLQIETPEEAMILASIIEKETSIAEEREIVSSVLHNRLDIGWRLQFDPTIIYGITRGVGTLGRPISNADISGRTEERRHGTIEYNTYQIDGLPAGPIGNPGEASIIAALNPAESPFRFFVATGDGGHAFAVTLDEHNANVARLRAIEAERAN